LEYRCRYRSLASFVLPAQGGTNLWGMEGLVEMSNISFGEYFTPAESSVIRMLSNERRRGALRETVQRLPQQ
jgi:hypothetical protein